MRADIIERQFIILILGVSKKRRGGTKAVTGKYRVIIMEIQYGSILSLIKQGLWIPGIELFRSQRKLVTSKMKLISLKYEQKIMDKGE